MIDSSLILEGETVLDKVNLNINSGSTTVIFGRSGSGKSTLLKCLAGLIKISDGQVLFNNDNILKMNEKHYFAMQAQSGFVFQDAALWSNRSIYDNLAIPLQVLDPFMDKKSIDKRIRSAVNMFNLKDNLMVRPSAISAGEKKIISFLRAMMTDPEILFLDEPTTSIDKKNVSRLNAIIKELKKRQKTIITVTHDFLLAKSIADNIILIDEGRIIKSGSFDSIIYSEDEEIINIIEEIKGQV
ncbi:MAG: ATP-binding cassette domain-containing protein [Spirochaetaceae bacterium]|nr:ATP-binding cassette domain-containing protein [Spirochaetaceae bacterium]